MVIGEQLLSVPQRVGRLVERRAYPAWMRQWQFWLVLGLAAILRLVAISHSPFSSDAALSFLEVARSSHDHVLPVTGEYDSILALEPPAYSFIILPFANHPFAIALITALANTTAVGLTYVLGARYFGRTAGFVAGLLMATALYDTWMSEFLWPPTLTIPVTLAALYFLYRGAIARKRFWLGPHLILLSIAVQLHPITASLALVTLVAIIFGWPALGLADAALGVAGGVLLFLPTAAFEYASGGIDLAAYRHWLALPKTLDGQVIGSLVESLGPRPADYFGPTVYTHVALWFAWLNGAIGTLWLIAAMLLLARILVPVLCHLRVRGPHDLRDLLRIAADAGWRARALLLLWPLSLLALSMRHATPVYPQYVYVVDPVAYLTIGVAAVDAQALLRQMAGRVVHVRALTRRWRLTVEAIAALPLPAVFTASGAQLIATAVFVLVLASGSGWGWSWSGIPIVRFTGALSTTSRWATRLHARQAYVVADPDDPYMGLYWAQRQNNLGGGVFWSSYVAQDCIIAPPATKPGIMLTLTDQGLALKQLVSADGVRLLQRVQVARGTTYAVYALPPAARSTPQATFNGEIALDAAFIATRGSGMPERLVTAWTVLASSSSTSSAAQYHFHFLFQQGARYADATSDCAPGGWRAGERLTVVTPLPEGVNAALAASVIVSRDTHIWYRPRFGPFVLDTAKELTIERVVLPPGVARGAGIACPDQRDLDASTVSIRLTGLNPQPGPPGQGTLASQAPDHSSVY
jgi:hypothetical protein